MDIGDLFGTALKILGPVAIGGVVWVYAQIQALRTDFETANIRLAAVESDARNHNNFYDRITKIETIIPYVQQSTNDIKQAVQDMQKSMQRMELAIVRNSPKADVG